MRPSYDTGKMRNPLELIGCEAHLTQEAHRIQKDKAAWMDAVIRGLCPQWVYDGAHSNERLRVKKAYEWLEAERVEIRECGLVTEICKGDRLVARFVVELICNN